MIITAEHTIQNALHPDVVQKLLLEDFIDDMSDEELGAAPVEAERERPYDHELVWLLSFRWRRDAVLMQPHLKQLCRRVLSAIDHAPFIRDYAAVFRTIDPEKENVRKWPYESEYPHIQCPLDADDPGSILTPLIEYMETKHFNYSVLCEIAVKCDFVTMTRNNAWLFMRMNLAIKNMNWKLCKQYCQGQVSQAFIFDKEVNNCDIADNKDSAQSVKLFQMICPNSDERYIREMLRGLQNAQEDFFHIPLDVLNGIKRLVKNYDAPCFAKTRVTVTVNDDDNAIYAICPEEHTVGILDIGFVTYCLWTWKRDLSDERKNYVIIVKVLGTLLIRNSLGWFKNNASMLQFVNEIHTVGTPFNMLNRYILPDCFVNRIVMKNPMFNTVGGNHQKTQIFPRCYKNPNVEITAVDYTVTRTSDSYRDFIQVDK